MSGILQDLVVAFRSLRKSPAFSLTAILTIALGIGASTAIFSVVSAVLLRPLPYQDPERLVLVKGDLTARNVFNFPMAPADYADLSEVGTLFEELAGIVTFQQPLIGDDGEPTMVRSAAVTTRFFSTLGARVVLGRDFVEDDGTPQPPPPADAPPDAPPPPQLPTSSIITHEFWQRHFGGDPNVIGQTVRFTGQTTTIVGVLEPGFEVLMQASDGVARDSDIYNAMRVDFAGGSRINVFLRVLGRLKPGVTRDQAQGQVDALVMDLRQRFPIKETAGVRWRVEPMHQDLVAATRPVILALMGAVTFVLLIACANVANLLLVRGAARERELAVRSALGGNRTTLLRQLMVESLVLAGVGTVVGLGLAWGGVRILLAMGPEDLPRLHTVSLDPLVLGFAVLAALAAALIFGMVPALRASRVHLADSLRAGSRSAGLAGGHWLRDGVVIAEVALAFVLLVGSGLMVRSFMSLQQADPGFDPEGVLTFSLPNLNRPDQEARAVFIRELSEQLAGLPGVTAVSSVSPLPLDGGLANARWGTEEALTDPSKFQQTNLHIVQPGYFAAMRTRLIDGRTFTEADNVPGLHLAVIDNILAAKAFPEGSPVGKRFLARVTTPEPEWFEVIGVVAHQRHETLAGDGREAMFLTDGHFQYGAATRWLVRSSGDPELLAEPARNAVRSLDRSVAVTEMQPMVDFLSRARAPTRFALTLIGVFAVIAVVLAAVGLYGVLATMVRQRTSEIGVRLAFGAEHGAILRLVVGQGLRLCLIGLVIGVGAALALTRVMNSMLVGVGATDPVTFSAMVAVFLVVAVLACLIPAQQAARLDPTEALRAG